MRGLSPADIDKIWDDVKKSFPELRPEPKSLCFRPMGPGVNGETGVSSGQICIDPIWAEKKCLTRDEYDRVFFTLFHEGMHSTDGLFLRLFRDEDQVHRREQFEQYWNGFPKYQPNQQKMWGKPRDAPVDMPDLYDRYRKRTPACNC